MEALTNRHRQWANIITEKVEILTREYVHPNDHDQYFKHPAAGQAHQSITEEGVKGALFSHSAMKAPGPTKLFFGAICLLWEWKKARIVGLAKAAVRMGPHPALWKWACRIAICKHRKDDCMKLMTYRSISPLSCIGKVVEKLVAKLLVEDAERRGQLSDGQYGSRKKLSAINAVAILVDRALAAW